MRDYLSDSALNQFIDAAFKEDIGTGDYSSLSSIPESAIGSAELKVKGNGILAGVELAERIFKRYDQNILITRLIGDGGMVNIGDVAFKMEGPTRSLLSCERLVLNCMQRMSGIATYAHKLQSLIAHTRAKVLDTRKTTPNFRIAEKWAVSIGGGANHRFALYDMVMLKDNHVDFAGGITKAVENCKNYLSEKNLNLEIEVETRNLKEVEEALNTEKVDRIMLDNMAPKEMAKAVKIVSGKVPLEASGGITEETIVEVAETGVDFISIGALTHSYKSLDLSLKAL